MWLFVVANQLEKFRSRSNQLEDDAGPIIMTPFCRRNTEKSGLRRVGVGCVLSQIFSRVGIEGQVEVAVLQHDRSYQSTVIGVRPCGGAEVEYEIAPR